MSLLHHITFPYTMRYQNPLFYFLISINLCTSVKTFPTCECFNSYGNYTANNTYHTNLNTLLSSLLPGIGDTGFYNASLGINSNQVHAMAMCRTDLQLDACRSCIQSASSSLVKTCLNRRQAIVWEDVCMVRYSNVSFFGTANSGITYSWPNLYNISSPEQFNKDLRTLIDGLRVQASSGGSQVKVAAGSKAAPNFMTIYSLLQCTPDISENDCMSCLIGCAEYLPSCCSNSRGVRILKPSCTLRYEANGPFYNVTRIEEVKRLVSGPGLTPTPNSVSGPPPPQRRNGDNGKTRTIVIIAAPILASLILVACLGAWLLARRNQNAAGTSFAVSESTDERVISTDQESMQYDFNKIREATDDFSAANKLGEGGFGVVYKGVLQNGQEIAVKRLVKGSRQGDTQFRNEVMLLAKLQHRNLVKLIGFAQEGKERVLVYEFIKNTSLDRFIFDPVESHNMDWNRRFKIIRGIAKGLMYLHEDSRLRVIHRDLKPSNILLDANMNPKIADFGMARLFEQDATVVSTSIIAGTLGYMAPEYMRRRQISVKSDVFSFGVLVLEIISGQRNNYFQTRNTETVGEGLRSFAMRNLQEGTIVHVVDPILRSTPGDFPNIKRCVHIALLCIEENASDRPTMELVVLMLSSSTVTLPLPSNPSFFEPQNVGVNASLSNGNNSGGVESFKLPDAVLAHANLSRNDDSSITELHPR